MPQNAAIVTGASSGIGFGIAEALLKRGYGVTLVSRRKEKLEQAAASLDAHRDNFQTVAADVGGEDDIRRTVDAHKQRFETLNLLVNNAGVGFRSTVDQAQTDKVDLQLAVNLRSIILFYRECTEMLAKSAAESGGSLVINTASIAGKSGQPMLSTYSATKAGVIAFTQAMNKALAEKKIKSAALCPGLVATEMTKWSEVPTDEMIQVKDVVAAVEFLIDLSPHCIVGEIAFTRLGVN